MIATERLELHLLGEDALRAVADDQRDGQRWHEDCPVELVHGRTIAGMKENS